MSTNPVFQKPKQSTEDSFSLLTTNKLKIQFKPYFQIPSSSNTTGILPSKDYLKEDEIPEDIKPEKNRNNTKDGPIEPSIVLTLNQLEELFQCNTEFYSLIEEHKKANVIEITKTNNLNIDRQTRSTLLKNMKNRFSDSEDEKVKKPRKKLVLKKNVIRGEKNLEKNHGQRTLNVSIKRKQLTNPKCSEKTGSDNEDSLRKSVKLTVR